MGIWDKIKSVFVDASEKVAETGQKVAEKAVEAGKQVAETTGEALERAGVDKVGAAVLDAGKKTMDKTADFTESVGGKVLDGTNATLTGALEAAGNLKEKTGDWLEKAGVDKVGAAILDKAAALKSNTADFAENAGAGILGAASTVSGSLQDAAKSALDKASDFMEKAQAAASEAHVIDKETTTPAATLPPNTIEVEGNVITVETDAEEIEVIEVISENAPEEITDAKGAEDFFDKAERWAKGDYSK